jgi:hypothetical protein
MDGIGSIWEESNMAMTVKAKIFREDSQYHHSKISIKKFIASNECLQ